MSSHGATHVPSIDAEVFRELIKQEGFTATLKLLKRGRRHSSGMTNVTDGVLEEQPSGLYDAALQTEKGRVVLQGARRTDGLKADPQEISFDRIRDVQNAADADSISPDQLLAQFSDAQTNAPASLICEVELTRFAAEQHQMLLPLLWQYIIHFRNSNLRTQLAAVGAAIRKYIAIMPMEEMGQLAVLLESGQKSPLPIELEIEVAKMIFRNFEVHPPTVHEPQPELAQQLWEMVQAYTNPRILLRDKYSAVGSASIQAIIAMRSQFAPQAWEIAASCPYRWFAELVSDNLDRLRERWQKKSPDAASWLTALLTNVTAQM